MNKAVLIWDKQQCIEAYDELMIKIAMSSYAGIDGQELLEENERLKRLPQFQVTPKIERNIRRTVQRETLRNSIYQVGKGFYWVASKVALVFLALSIVFGSTMIASADFRSAIYKLVFTYEKQYTLIELDSRTDLEFVNSEVYTWEHAFAPTMLPQGYQVSEVVNTTIISRVVYTNDVDGYIELFQNSSGSDGAIQVDTELAQSVRTVFINDSEGIIVSKDGINTLVWRIGNTFLSLESNEDSEMLITIAKGIKLLK